KERPHWMQRYETARHQREVNSGDHHAEREAHSAHDMAKRIVQFEGSEVEHSEQQEAHPSRQKEDADSPQVIPILRRKAAAQGLPRPEMVELGVSFDGPRNLEARGAQQAHPLANLAVERNHRLRAEENVVARPAARG